MVHAHLSFKVLSQISHASENWSSSGGKNKVLGLEAGWEPTGEPWREAIGVEYKDHPLCGKKQRGLLQRVCSLPVESELGLTSCEALEFCYLSGIAIGALSWKGKGSQIEIIITSKRLAILRTCSNSTKSQAERKPCQNWVPFNQTLLCIWRWSPSPGNYLQTVTTYPSLSSTTLVYSYHPGSPIHLKSVLVWTTNC